MGEEAEKVVERLLELNPKFEKKHKKLEVEAVKSVGNGESSEIDVLYDDVEFQYEIPKYLVAENRVYYVMTDVMGYVNWKMILTRKPIRYP